MSSTSPNSTGGYEFDDSQNQLIGDLSRKMALVGFMMIFFGALQLINGVSTLFMTRDPARITAAAEKAGMSPDQVKLLGESMAGGMWSSPLAISALAFAIAGLLLLLVGVWTRQAAGGFAGIVMTKGQDITRLMDALHALHRKYAMIYYVILIAAVISLVSLAVSFWQSRGGA